MANISIKKDFEDGQKLFAQQLNNNFETIEMGVNSGNKIIWKDDNGAEFQTFRGTTEEIEKRPIIDGQTLYNIETGEMLLDTGDSRRTINKPLWKDDNTSEVTSFRGTTEEIKNRPIIDGQKLYNIETGETALDVGETRKVMNKPLWKDNNASEVTSFRGTTEEIAARPISDGQKLYNIENGDTFLDVGETRKAMNKQLWNDNGAQVQPFRGTAEEIAARPIIDGQTLYNIETGETALDVGGKRISTGAGNVVYIGDEEPQNDATKIWIENDQVLNLGSEVAISSEEPTTQEKLWIDNVNKKIHTKTDNGYEEFYNEENREVYSTSEQRIGTWIDGKPLYRRVISSTLASSINTVKTIATIENFDSIARFEGYFMSSGDNYFYPLPFAYNNEEITVHFKRTDGTINESHNYTGANNLYCYAIVEYTKTTD